MPVEFIGMIQQRAQSEIHPPSGPAIDVDYLSRFIRAHEDAGFDRVLIGYFSGGPDGWSIASHGASITDRLGFLLAHRPGFVSPTVAARKAATLDHLSGGRLALHIITGGSDVEQQKDGDYLDKVQRYARTDEFLDILKQTWTSTRPFDYEGNVYRVTQAYSEVKPIQQPHLPIYFGGSSEEALTVAAKHADVWALWGEPLIEARWQIEEVNRRAASFGRTLRTSISFRPILGTTEARAWERAQQILERTKALRGDTPALVRQNRGSQRLLEFAAEGDILDERLYTAIAKVTGAAGNSTALVGTPDQVAEALLQYYDAGATTLLIRGYDPLDDAIDYGRDLLPIVREEVRLRDLRSANTAALAAVESREKAAVAG
ncbi:MAG: LLM class flavin-dependent oxidoreductase [Dehalococcoidia bacterium]